MFLYLFPPRSILQACMHLPSIDFEPPSIDIDPPTLDIDGNPVLPLLNPTVKPADLPQNPGNAQQKKKSGGKIAKFQEEMPPSMETDVEARKSCFTFLLFFTSDTRRPF